MIGRVEQLEKIDALKKSKQAEFIAVTGRRRVGKTYLIDNGFAGQIVFQISGIQDANTRAQIDNFDRILKQKTRSKKIKSKDWGEAFFNLRIYLEKLPPANHKHVIFIDELPWMATSKSGCLQQLANLWNDFLSKQSKFILVICGSASSWIVNNITNDKGGLHNRLTEIINVQAFTFKEVASYFKSKNIKLTNLEIAKIYMAFGGIPFYLSAVKKGDNATSAIDRICFSQLGKLRTEYDNLYKALFFNASIHEKITAALSASQKGMLRNDILKKCKLEKNGSTARAFEELIQCGFINTINQFGKKKRDEVYRLNDEFTNFYHKFMKPQGMTVSSVWKEITQTQSYKTWMGYTFEYIVHKHIDLIKSKLGIIGVYAEISTHYYNMGKSDAMQIDLLLDRKDNTISYCEIKFTENAYTLDKKNYEILKEKLQYFKDSNDLKKYIQCVYISNNKVKETAYSNEIIDVNIVLNDLFE